MKRLHLTCKLTGGASAGVQWHASGRAYAIIVKPFGEHEYFEDNM